MNRDRGLRVGGNEHLSTIYGLVEEWNHKEYWPGEGGRKSRILCDHGPAPPISRPQFPHLKNG